MNQAQHNWVESTLRKRITSIEAIQQLWSGYGMLSRVYLDDGSSVIVKLIQPAQSSSHPRNWNTSIGHQRKLKSYQVELNWYQRYGALLSSNTRIPALLGALETPESTLFILEDLDIVGFPERKQHLTLEEAIHTVEWLARFHATFMNSVPTELWNQGTYWHLETRPEELDLMPENWLKMNASKIDQTLEQLQFKSIIHGDAKVANFCYSANSDAVAAVDFQYVGGGCGMKDLAYFISSCCTPEEAMKWEELLLDKYFAAMAELLPKEITQIEAEWRPLYPVAWADFIRFLQGWAPDHAKLNTHSLQKIEECKTFLS